MATVRKLTSAAGVTAAGIVALGLTGMELLSRVGLDTWAQCGGGDPAGGRGGD